MKAQSPTVQAGPWQRMNAAFDAEFGDRQAAAEREPAAASRCDRTRDMFEGPQQDAARVE